MSESARDRNNRIVKQLSSRVVAGWTLLSESCPACNTALVRSRQGQKFCVDCSMNIVTEDEAKQRHLYQAAPTSPVSAASSSSSSSSSSKAPASASPVSPEAAALSSSKPSDRDSESFSNLSSSPQFEKLQRELATERKAGYDDDEEEEEEAKARNGVHGLHNNADENEDDDQVDAASISGAMSRLNMASSKLGAKLLAGWTMLSVHCPNDSCACPLMKNPQTSEMFCVNCEQVYVDEDHPQSAGAPTIEKAKNNTTANTTVDVHSHTNRTVTNSNTSTTTRQSAPTPTNQSVLSRPSSASACASASYTASSKSSSSNVAPVVEESDDEFSHLLHSRYRSEHRKDPNAVDVPSRLGDKLLSGYTMLADECPNPACSCPLVRKKDGPKLCVQCGQSIYAPLQQQQQQQDVPEQPASSQPELAVPNVPLPASLSASSSALAPSRVISPSAAQILLTSTSPSPAPKSDTAKPKRAAFADSVVDTETASEGFKRSKNEASLRYSLTQRDRGNAASIGKRDWSDEPAAPSRSPPATPAPTPAPGFSSGPSLPTSTHLSASISSTFPHAVFPPGQGAMSRHTSIVQSTSPEGAFGHANIGLGHLHFASPANARLSAAFSSQGKFSFRSQSAAASHRQVGITPSQYHLPAVSPSIPHDSPPDSNAFTSPVAVAPSLTMALTPAQQILSASLDTLYLKLEELRRAMQMCAQIDQITVLAAAMREVTIAIQVTQQTMQSFGQTTQ